MRTLYLIPARAGSKGLPGKNTRLLNGKPLIAYSIEFAIASAAVDDTICISTDDLSIEEIAAGYGIKLPFIRPAELATDTAGSREVILHAINYYEGLGREFDAVLLLQPTSPFRANADKENIFAAFDSDCDMAVSVKASKDNPYFNMFEENENGFLVKSKAGNYTRRQDCPEVYCMNGSLYLIRVSSLKNKKMGEFEHIRKVLMPEERSIDIDTMRDWQIAEMYTHTK